MPKFRMERQESGQRYTTYEIEAPTKEEAEEMIFEFDEANIVGQYFKQRDSEILSFKEIS